MSYKDMLQYERDNQKRMDLLEEIRQFIEDAEAKPYGGVPIKKIADAVGLTRDVLYETILGGYGDRGFWSQYDKASDDLVIMRVRPRPMSCFAPPVIHPAATPPVNPYTGVP
jgi:hypothetical protein